MIANHPMIELRGLGRDFGATRAVRGISFSVRAGEVVGYIGPNGAGKTTSMRILATLDQPSYGDAYIDGFSVVDDPDRVRRRLGFMPDHFGTYGNVNVWEYLDFFARAYGLRNERRRAALDQVLSFTKLDTLADKPMSGLSKGMKQRLCLGRTLIHDPAVLVLDEPAAGLDPRARIELREMIRRLATLGKTVLISSHILTELAEMCDRVVIIEQGQLLAVGSVDEILRGETQEQVAQTTLQVAVLDDPDNCASWLAQREGVSEVRRERDQCVFSLQGGAQEQAALLRGMIEAGLPVTFFGARERSLEEVFMQVTKGRVQ